MADMVTIERDIHLQTRRLTLDVIQYIAQKIAHHISPQQIILFGSYARGEASEDSDLDLFIIQDSQATNREVRRKIEILLWGREFGVDLIVRKPEEIALNVLDNNPFYTEHLLKEGLVLYERAT